MTMGDGIGRGATGATGPAGADLTSDVEVLERRIAALENEYAEMKALLALPDVQNLEAVKEWLDR